MGDMLRSKNNLAEVDAPAVGRGFQQTPDC